MSDRERDADLAADRGAARERVAAWLRAHRAAFLWTAAFLGLAAVTYERVPAAEAHVPPAAALPWPLDVLAYVDWVLLALVAATVVLLRVADRTLLSPRSRERARFALLVLGMLAIVAALSYRARTGVNVGFLAGLVVFVLIWGLFALGLNVEFGDAGLVNFGHVAFMAIGAYGTVLLALDGDWPLWAAAVGGVLLAALAGVLLGLPTVRLREDYLAIVTIGAAEILRLALLNEERWTGGARGLLDFPDPVTRYGDAPALEAWSARLDVGEATLIMLGLSAAAVLLAFVLFQGLARSPWGRVLKAIREDEEVAAALGKNVFAYKLQALALGSGAAGLAGALVAWNLRFVNPDMFTATVTFEAWIIVVLGGAGNPKGALAGAMLFWTFNEATKFLQLYDRLGLTEPQGAAFRVVLIGLLMILVMRFQPEGLLGKREELAYAR